MKTLRCWLLGWFQNVIPTELKQVMKYFKEQEITYNEKESHSSFA